MRKLLFVVTIAILAFSCKKSKDVITSHAWYMFTEDGQRQKKDSTTILTFFNDGQMKFVENGWDRSEGKSCLWHLDGNDLVITINGKPSNSKFFLSTK